MKSLIKILVSAVIITLLILIVGIVAAPFFVRQEQVKAFIEKNAKLPDNQKLKLEGDLEFGFFPRMYVNVPKASILKDGIATHEFSDFALGFELNDLLGDSIDFDVDATYKGITYEGNLYIAEYEKFINSKQSPINIELEKPVAVKIKGDYKNDNNDNYFNNFVITHKQTKATGDISFKAIGDGNTEIKLNTKLNSDNIDDIRRLIDFEKYEDSFNLLSGEGSAILDVITKGRSSEEFKANLNGTGYVEINDAAVYGLDLNEIIGSPSEAGFVKDSDRKIDISSASTKLDFVNGLIKVSELTANNQFANIYATGAVDIVQEVLTMNVDVLTEIADTKVKIPLVVGGAFNNIKFAPRAGDILLDNLNKIEDLKKVRLENVKIKIDKKNLDALKNIGKGFGLDVGKLLGEKPAVEPEAAPDATPTVIPAPEGVAPTEASPAEAAPAE